MIDSTNVIKEEERNSAEMLIVIMVLEFFFDIFVVIFVKNIISTPPLPRKPSKASSDPNILYQTIECHSFIIILLLARQINNAYPFFN